MAIQLITGSPGAGKTAYVVSELVDLVGSAKKKGKQPRQIVVMGIPELVLDHVQAGPVDTWATLEPTPEDETVEEAVFTFPDGALIVIDEAQKVFRPRPVGSKVPPIVAAFEKHRHKGLDFWLITQHPTLLDSNVRKLVGKHVHLRGHWAGRELLEWPEASDPSSKSERASAIKRPYKLPKNIFSLYKSASVHIKQKKRLPVSLLIFGGAVLLALGLGVYAYQNVSNRTVEVESDVPPPIAPDRVVPVIPDHPGRPVANLTLDDFKPRLRGRPESAPLYDGIRQVVEAPHVVGCMELRDDCKCFTGQGTDVRYTVAECRAWLENPPFQPFRAVYPVQPVSRPPISEAFSD